MRARTGTGTGTGEGRGAGSRTAPRLAQRLPLALALALCVALLAVCTALPTSALSLSPVTPFYAHLWSLSPAGCQQLLQLPLPLAPSELKALPLALPHQPHTPAHTLASRCPPYAYDVPPAWVPAGNDSSVAWEAERDYGAFAGPGLLSLAEALAAVDQRGERIYTVEHERNGTYSLVSRKLASTAANSSHMEAGTRIQLERCAPHQMALAELPSSSSPTAAPRSILLLLCVSPQEVYDTDPLTGVITPRAWNDTELQFRPRMSVRAVDVSGGANAQSTFLDADALEVGLSMSHAAVGVSTVDSTHGDLLFVGLSGTDSPAPAGPEPDAYDPEQPAWLPPHLFAARLANPNVRGEVRVEGMESVQAIAWAQSLQALLLLSDTELRVAPLASSLAGRGVGTSLATLPVAVARGAGAESVSSGAFVFADQLPDFHSLQSTQLRWLPESASVLLAARSTNGSMALVAITLQVAPNGNYTVTDIRRQAMDDSPITLAGAMAPRMLSAALNTAVEHSFIVQGVGLHAQDLSREPTLWGLQCEYLIVDAAGQALPGATAEVAPLVSSRAAFDSSRGTDSEVTCGASAAPFAPGSFVRVSLRFLGEPLGGHAIVQAKSYVIVLQPLVEFYNPRSSIAQGQLLRLLVDIISLDLMSMDLEYSWTVSQPDVLSFALIGGMSDDTLTIDTTQLTVGVTYVFQATVTDVDPNHRTATGAIPRGSVDVHVLITPPVANNQHVTAGESNPCAGQSSLCQNGGLCMATPLAGTGGQYELSCLCRSAPVRFFGPTCSFAVVSCPNCVSPYVGGASLTLYGLGFDGLAGLRVAGRAAPFSAVTHVSAASSVPVQEALDRMGLSTRSGLDAITFSTPALVDSNSTANPQPAYQPLGMDVLLPATAQLQQLSFPGMLFYTSQSCTAAGVWKDDGRGGCLPCPAGAYCPGGGRAWPIEGWWSWSESSAPVQCTMREQCPGVDPSLINNFGSGAGVAPTDPGADPITQRCGAGYQGVRCAQCAENYYQLEQRCVACGSTTDQSRDLSLIILVGLAAMGALALAVAFVPALPLAYLIQLFVVLQDLATVSVQGAKQLPVARTELTSAAVYFNMLNFDLEILRPGCGGVPTFNFVKKFQFTLLFMALAAGMFLLACMLRLCWRVHRTRSRRMRRLAQGQGQGDDVQQLQLQDEADQLDEQSKRDDQQRIVSDQYAQAGWLRRIVTYPSDLRATCNASHLRDFRQRLTHSTLILLTIFYLRLVILQFKTFRCAHFPDPVPASVWQDGSVPASTSLYLEEDMQTRCFSSDHLALSAGVIALFIFYTLAFPFGCFVLLMRAFATEETQGVLGYLWRTFPGLRGKPNATAGGPVKRSAWDATTLEIRSKDEEGAAEGHEQQQDQLAAPVSFPASDAPSSVHEKYLSKQDASVHPTTGSSPQDDRAAASDSDADADASLRLRRSRENEFGFLFLGLRPHYFYVCLSVFAISLCVACITVFVDERDSLLQMFLFGFMWSAFATMLASSLPYEQWTTNVSKILVALASVAHALVFLAVQAQGLQSPYFIVLIVAFGLAAILLLLREQLARLFHCCRMPHRFSKEGREEESKRQIRMLEKQAAAAAAAGSSDSGAGSSNREPSGSAGFGSDAGSDEPAEHSTMDPPRIHTGSPSPPADSDAASPRALQPLASPSRLASSSASQANAVPDAHAAIPDIFGRRPLTKAGSRPVGGDGDAAHVHSSPMADGASGSSITADDGSTPGPLLTGSIDLARLATPSHSAMRMPPLALPKHLRTSSAAGLLRTLPEIGSHMAADEQLKRAASPPSGSGSGLGSVRLQSLGSVHVPLGSKPAGLVAPRSIPTVRLHGEPQLPSLPSTYASPSHPHPHSGSISSSGVSGASHLLTLPSASVSPSPYNDTAGASDSVNVRVSSGTPELDSLRSLPSEEVDVALVAAEEEKLRREAEEKQKREMEEASKKATKLPPSLMSIYSQLVARRRAMQGGAGAPAAGDSAGGDAPLAPEDQLEMLQDAFKSYSMQCDSFLFTQSMAVHKRKIGSHGEPEPAALIDADALAKHVKEQMAHWEFTITQMGAKIRAGKGGQEGEEQARAQAQAPAPGSVSTALASLASAESGVDVSLLRELGSVDCMSSVLLAMGAEAERNAALMRECAEAQRRAQEEAEQLEAQRVYDEEAHPSALDRALSEAALIAATLLDGEGDAQRAELQPGHVAEKETQAAKATDTSPQMMRALKALRVAAANIIDEKRAQAQQRGDDAARIRFEHMVRELKADTVDANAIGARTRTQADEQLLAKISKGRTSKECRVLRAALHDAALLAAFQQDLADKDAEVTSVMLRLRADKQAQAQAHRRRQAEMRVRRAQQHRHHRDSPPSSARGSAGGSVDSSAGSSPRAHSRGSGSVGGSGDASLGSSLRRGMALPTLMPVSAGSASLLAPVSVPPSSSHGRPALPKLPKMMPPPPPRMQVRAPPTREEP